MVTSGSSANGVRDVSPYLRVQAESLEEIGWSVRYSLVDDRRSFGGIRRNARRLVEEVNSSCPGVVHAQFGSVIAGIACCSRQAAPLVISLCGSDLLGSFNSGITLRLRDSAARFISIAAADRAAALVVKSQNLFDRLPPRLQRNAVILPNGVDVKRFFPKPQVECRSQLGWRMGSKIILFNAGLGENQRAKNLPLAQATISAVRRSFPDVCFQIISNTGYELMPILLNAADCLLVTSFSEGSANLPKEAMACGLPVVSVPCGDASERLATTHPGSVCPYNPDVLGQAIREVLSSERRSNGPEQLVVQGLTSPQVARRLVDIYASVQLRGRTTYEAVEQRARLA